MRNIHRLHKLVDRLDVSKVRHPRLVDVLRNLEHDGFMFRSKGRHHADYSELVGGHTDHDDVFNGMHTDYYIEPYTLHRDHSDHTDHTEYIHEDISGTERPNHHDSNARHHDYNESTHTDYGN